MRPALRTDYYELKIFVVRNTGIDFNDIAHVKVHIIALHKIIIILMERIMGRIFCPKI